MSTGNVSGKTIYQGFFLSGLVMTVACFALIFARNTAFGYQVEHTTAFPLSWAFAGAALVQFVAAEICHHAVSAARRANQVKPQQTSIPEAIPPQVVHFTILR